MMVWKRLKKAIGKGSDRLQLRMAVKSGVTAALSFVIGVGFSKIFDRPDTLVSGLWTVLSAVVVVNSYLGGTYLAAWIRLLGTFVGVIVAGIGITLFGADPTALGLSVFFTVILCSALRLSDSVRIASITVAIVVVLWGLRPEISPWAFGLFRFIDSAMGILVAVIVAHTLWPTQATRKMRINMVSILHKIRDYYLAASDIDVDAEKKCSRLAQEIALLIAETKEHLRISRVEIRTRTSLEDWSALLEHLQALFDAAAMLEQVNKVQLTELIDDVLKSDIMQMRLQLEKVLVEIAAALALRQHVENHVDISSAFLEVDKKLDAYRERKGAPFSLNAAETFFVFFYGLRQIGSQLDKIDDRLRSLYQN